MAVTNAIGIAADQTCYAVMEDTSGTLQFPTAVDTVIATAGYIDMSQNPSFTDSEEITNSRDVLNRFQDQAPAGTWSVPIYARPGGTAGDKPMGFEFFHSLMGTETEDSGVKYTYSQHMDKPSFSLWSKKGHTVFFASGAVATKMSLSASNKGGVKLSFSGGFMQMGWAGTADLSAAATAGASSIVLQSGEGKKFTVGARIWNETKAVATAHTVTAVNTTTDTLTITPVVPAGDWAENDVIAGYLPSTGTAVGEALEGKDASITMDAVEAAVQTMSLDIDDGVKYMEDEISSDEYPTDYMEMIRNISGSMSLYFRTNDVKYFYDGYNNNQVATILTIGDTAGKRMVITMSKAELEVPMPKTSAPAINLDIKYKALGTSGEDSCSIAFT